MRCGSDHGDSVGCIDNYGHDGGRSIQKHHGSDCKVYNDCYDGSDDCLQRVYSHKRYHMSLVMQYGYLCDHSHMHSHVPDKALTASVIASVSPVQRGHQHL